MFDRAGTVLSPAAITGGSGWMDSSFDMAEYCKDAAPEMGGAGRSTAGVLIFG